MTVNTPTIVDPPSGSLAWIMMHLVESTELLADTKKTQMANRLSYTNDVLNQIKNMPKITPPIPTTRFSELMPNQEESTDEDETEQKPQPKSTGNRILNKIRRRTRI